MTPENTLGDARYAPLRPLRDWRSDIGRETLRRRPCRPAKILSLWVQKVKILENRALRAPWNPLSADENPDFALALQKMKTPPK